MNLGFFCSTSTAFLITSQTYKGLHVGLLNYQEVSWFLLLHIDYLWDLHHDFSTKVEEWLTAGPSIFTLRRTAVVPGSTAGLPISKSSLRWHQKWPLYFSWHTVSTTCFILVPFQINPWLVVVVFRAINATQQLAKKIWTMLYNTNNYKHISSFTCIYLACNPPKYSCHGC